MGREVKIHEFSTKNTQPSAKVLWNEDTRGQECLSSRAVLMWERVQVYTQKEMREKAQTITSICSLQNSVVISENTVNHFRQRETKLMRCSEHSLRARITRTCVCPSKETNAPATTRILGTFDPALVPSTR